jgi:hypothetical protein
VPLDSVDATASQRFQVNRFIFRASREMTTDRRIKASVSRHAETLALLKKIDITEEMISAAADVLYFDPQLDIPRGSAEKMAEEMIRCAFQASDGKHEVVR